MADKILIFVPTYNEGDNIGPLLRQILALGIDADILVIDDQSSDQTAAVVREIAQANPRVSLQERAGKLGIGSAHLAALRFAKLNGYTIVVTMDADFSHQPTDIPAFLAEAGNYDVVLGSRYVRSTSLQHWKLHRKILTHFGHFLTTVLLRLPYDASGGFRLYRVDRIPMSLIDQIDSKDYEFFFESLTMLHVGGYRIGEVPIDLPARTYGHSKMELGHIIRAVLRLLKLSLKLMAKRGSMARGREASNPSDSESMTRLWDHYWSGEKKSGGTSLYNRIASFYRDYLIEPTLLRAIRNNFPPGATLLHAGCGGGQVDINVIGYAKVIAFDISSNAIAKYRALNGDKAETIIGDLFTLDKIGRKVDGIYNLGVMEHFDHEQIKELFRKFNRVLQPNGRLVIFWPPAYGLSVIVLHGAHFVLNTIFRRKIQLHPPEPTKYTTRTVAQDLLRAGGFELRSVEFGPRDFFTHAILVADKVREIEEPVKS